MSRRHNVFLTAVLLLALTAGCAGQSGTPSVRAKADRRIVLIGDRIKYTFTVLNAKKLEIKSPEFKDDRIGNFEIKDIGPDWYSLAAYEVGKLEIPPIDIRYRKKGAKDWQVVKTKPIAIEVRSVLPAKGTIGDIKDIKEPFGFFEINWPLVGLLIIILAIAGFFIIRKLRRKAPVRLPHETALEELESAKSQFLKSGDVKEYYVSVSDCVRRFIEKVLKLKAPEMTTEEFLTSLGDTNILTMEEKSLLREFLGASDLVKFARYAPKTAEIDAVYETAKRFIEAKKNFYANL